MASRHPAPQVDVNGSERRATLKIVMDTTDIQLTANRREV
jgi:hypothetical protein